MALSDKVRSPWAGAVAARRVVFALAACLLLLAPTGALADNHRPDSRLQPPSVIDPALDPCRFYTRDEPMVSFSIEMDIENRMIPMRVPARFFEDRSMRHDGAVHLAALIPVTVPEFEPIRRSEEARRNREGLPWDWMHFLINDILPLEETVGLRLRDPGEMSLQERLEERGNLPHPRDFPAEPGPHGLTRVIAPDRLRGEDLFVHYDENGDLAGWMICGVRGVRHTQNEGCRHQTRHSGLDVAINYRRTELPNWRAIHDNVGRFLECAVTAASDGG